MMKEGRITEMGTYDELLANKGAFAEFLIEQLNDQEVIHEETELSTAGILSEAEKDEIKAKLEVTLGKKDLNKFKSKFQRQK